MDLQAQHQSQAQRSRQLFSKSAAYQKLVLAVAAERAHISDVEREGVAAALLYGVVRTWLPPDALRPSKASRLQP